MAINREFYKTRKDGVNLYRTFSDESYKLRKVGTDEIYDEAIDMENMPYSYEETDEPIEELTTEGTSSDNSTNNASELLEDKLYKSIIDNNVRTPTAYPTCWGPITV